MRKKEKLLQLSKEQLIHILLTYKHSLDCISEVLVRFSKWEIGEYEVVEAIRVHLGVLNDYKLYQTTKELSDEFDFRMGKITAEELQKRKEQK